MTTRSTTEKIILLLAFVLLSSVVVVFLYMIGKHSESVFSEDTKRTIDATNNFLLGPVFVEENKTKDNDNNLVEKSAISSSNRMCDEDEMIGSTSLNGSDNNRERSIQISHVGNSIQYYNDCPRFLQKLLQIRFDNVKQDSCLRGGANLVSILEKGNGMNTKFASRPESILEEDEGRYDIGASAVENLIRETAWDYIVMNDHTQAPVRSEQKRASMSALRTRYIPMILNNNNTSNPPPTVVFVQTAAYKSPVKNSSDLGGFEAFTDKLVQGYEDYASLIRSSGKISAKIAPFSLAVRYVKEHLGNAMWEKLYHTDDFHPSPLGTYLESCVLYCTIVGEIPPEQYDVSWWDKARYFPDGVKEFPTAEEVKLLRAVSWQVCKEI